MRAKGICVILRDAVLLADFQCPPGKVGGRRWRVAKDVNECGVTPRLGEGHRVPEGLGAFYRCPQLIEGPVRVAQQPGDQHWEQLACHGGVGPRPIRELHVRIEYLEAPPKLYKRWLDFPPVVQHQAERQVRPDEMAASPSRSATRQRLLSKMLRLLHLG
jgi:hypothetical protein